MSKGFVLHLGLWLALGLSVCQAGERFENSEVCNLDPKNEVSCRENMGWGLHCHERHRCRTKDLSPLEYNSSAMACSDEEIAKRAGHVCEGFPWYNGGYPLHKLKWDEEDEYSKCITPARDGTHCEKWLSSEDSRDEWEAGSCTCDKTKTWIGPNFNRTFCSEWSCEQIEVSKCPPQAAMIDQTSRRWFDRWDWGRYGWSWPYDRATRKTWLQDRFPGYDPSLMPQGPWNFFPYQCIDCQDNCVHVGPEVETERSLCECREDYAGSCVKWFCLEFDDAGRHDVEEEWYTAISLDQNGKVVAEWMGDIESRSEFELSHCHCITVAQSGLYCEEWR
ncbi:hypothetical protein HOP50_02g15760 [Chloropicon primus]|uniref:Uncharacterized protein n=1 Tax=Chloropicon primus TaxID=1764295 RepID=A0A5B8MF86_9CHLO|nr:hypothetical protein A3770_02p15850 [Chloropicon primus]UPQ98276.1 hypothetical protein HOP50_02g15760 [Chloropicon primus]|eukprot:QDZ19067.1 hypothetical protein A3770_02p15850 [Chloropicon primus]